jgi:hypothetical protein
MNAQLVYALLLIVGLIILGCHRAAKATDAQNLPTNATSPKPVK